MPATQSAPARLSLDAIVDAAIGLIRRDGFDALSMRKLAQHCGVGAMTLYGYVQTKEELLTAVAEHFLAELRFPDARLAWQDQLKQLLRSMYRVLLEHPELADIVARQPMNSTLAFRGAEFALAAMARAGLAPGDAMTAFIALTSFTAGFAQRRTQLGQTPALLARRVAKLRGLPAAEFPQVTRLSRQFLRGPSARDLDAGLDLIIRGIESQVRP